MEIFVPISILAFVIAVAILLRFYSHVRRLNRGACQRLVEISATRYRPMLRLLAYEDFDIAARDLASYRQLRADRRKVFREYIRYLSEDYGELLAGIRLVMIQSKVDRPDLAKALLKNKTLFAFALCHIDARLILHALGIGSVDATGLVDAFEMLRKSCHGATAPAFG